MLYRALFYGLNLKDAISPLQEELVNFHDIIFNILIFISLWIAGSIWGVWFRKSFRYSLLEKKQLEIVWTILPAGVLFFLAVPSLRLLYYMDLPYAGESEGASIKIIGHQWYWSYEYLKSWTGEEEVYDSFMVPRDELLPGAYRLLETDKPLLLLCNHHRLIQGITSDVIHSWACQPLGVKIDVIPGRLNSASLIASKVGTFYGQCSEICGANHRFMPIEVEVVPKIFNKRQ